MKYEAGEVLSGERLPEVSEMYGDRRNGMWVWLRQGDDMVVLVPNDSMEPVVLDILDRSSLEAAMRAKRFMDERDRSSNAWSRDHEKKSVQTTQYGKKDITTLLPMLTLDSTIHDAAAHWAASVFMPCSNKGQFEMFCGLWSREWNEMSHAILLSDWDHVDTNAEGWWRDITPFEDRGLNELARNAIWWGQMMLSAEPVAADTELF